MGLTGGVWTHEEKLQKLGYESMEYGSMGVIRPPTGRSRGRKTRRRGLLPISQLCDFCPETVCENAAEADPTPNLSWSATFASS
ncbi:hypothetical protein SDJN03_21803, partial [Cucurbita argyrosperma subsp. sororia]